MEDKKNSLGLYVNIVIVSSLLFLKSMQLYGAIGGGVFENSQVTKNPRTRKILAQIIGTIGACGSSMERLPDPPPGAEEADQLFRKFGKDILLFAKQLKALHETSKIPTKRQLVQEIGELKELVKHDFHDAVQAFELAYPGQLTRALKSQSSNSIDEVYEESSGEQIPCQPS